nr:HlyD family efflux transporter periplasmic adaptor subunit [Halomonas socia]
MDPRSPGHHDRSEPTLGARRRYLDDGPTERNDHRSGHAPEHRARPQGETHASPRAGERLRHERRDERQHVRISPPFRVELADGRRLNGLDLSLGGFAAHADTTLAIDSLVDASLLVEAGGAELIIPLQARCLRCHPFEAHGDHKLAFQITAIDPPHLELLRQVVRAYLSGRHASIERLVSEEDPQTPRKRKQTSGPTPPGRTPKPWGRYALLFAAAGVLVVAAAATAYRNFMLIEPSFAAVTAPRIDIRAPGAGILREHQWEAGDRVERDEYLTGVNNSDLESDLILAQASHRYNSQLIDNLQASLDDPNAQQVSLVNSTQPASGDTVNYETASPEIAQARVEQFETTRDYESSRISALQSRMSMNEITSPCDCLVAWALSSADGTYINESERIMTLIRTGEDDVMVEALVHMSDIVRIEPEQVAYVALPYASEPIRAQVRSVALDVERQPRAGFPDWVRQQQNVASVLLVPETDLPADAVGQPVDVRFAEQPMLAAGAEWVWQGGRAMAQFVERLYQAARGAADAPPEQAQES